MNIGISEQHMISFAAGMALNKKKVSTADQLQD